MIESCRKDKLNTTPLTISITSHSPATSFFQNNPVIVEGFGIQQSATLDPLLTSGIPLSVSERTALTDFLKTLTDYKLTTDTKFAAQ